VADRVKQPAELLTHSQGHYRRAYADVVEDPRLAMLEEGLL
jgi:hypothetical protein